MPPDIPELLKEAVANRTPTSGFEAIWRRSRKLRVRKLVASGLASVALIGLFVVAVAWVREPASKLPVVGDSSPTQAETSPQAIEVGGSPIAIAVGEGSVWVGKFEGSGEQTNYSIVRVDPETNEVVATIPLDGRPEDLISGEGGLWVTLSFHPSDRGEVVQVDPVTNEIEGRPTPTEDRPSGLAVGGGSIWVTTGNRTVLRIDPQRHEVVAELEIEDQPVLAARGDSVWVANTPGDVSRIDLESNRTVDPPTSVGWNIVGIAVDDYGVWLTQVTPEERFRVLRIDPQTAELAGEPIPIELNPGRLVVGEGAVWVLQHAIANKDIDRDGTIIRIDPQSNRIVGEPIPSGVGSVDLAVGEGSLWVAKAGEGIIYRIDPNG